MQKKKSVERFIEVTVTVTFIMCVILIGFFGFWYFAGFQYAPPSMQLILKFITIIFYVCLLYFAYRFLRWVAKIIKKTFSHPPQNKGAV